MKGRKILVYLSLIVVLPSLISCSSERSQKLERVSQLPISQDEIKARITTPYVLEVGDEVTIQVWGFDDLKRSSLYIDTSGEITFPMVGRVKIAGQTVPKAEGMIATGLKKYIIDPQVDINVNTSQRLQILVCGEVNQAGVITFRRPFTVQEAVGKAGWFNLSANQSKVILIRRANDKYNVFAVPFGDTLQDGQKIQQFYLQAGDIVYVPPTGIVKLERFLQHISTLAQPFLTVEQAVVLWPQFVDAIEGKGVSTGLAISTPTTSTTSTTGTTTSTTK
jgi:protein involved in polysaccharide export with SLBB domain